MKKTILISGLALMSMTTFAQTGKTAASKPDTLLQLPAINKADAKVILNAMLSGAAASETSDYISAKANHDAQGVFNVFIALIEKKYPDLIPKQK